MSSTSQWIEVDGDDGKFGAYLALPRGGKGPGIVLAQEIFGVNAHIRGVADQYAADGYVVLAPDLFWRQGARIELGYDEADWKRAVELKTATDTGKARADVAAAAATLRALPGVEGRIASIGYCYGGLLSYHAAADGVVDAAIAYYGGGIQNALDRADGIRLPLMLHFGGKDSHIPMSAVKSVAERFAEQDNVEIHVYPEAEHGFNCSHRASYHQQSAALAHGYSLIFLSEML
ncbi:dienelactone hydrolase family protein [Pseudoduganella namucuonensis]|uniref:Carboxymethylenebutenolidase n=1 Tax=Pseudoduganella namucuonensis TaxID=1035707 RepID=A0A1I7IIN7_9BURK|nr:dienelactone hydrolase family protein [Pseudoduganella namucuonensis]SFU72794.1 carboxymethylenebutenolidase [Pseudoduganella namucuonensis]